MFHCVRFPTLFKWRILILFQMESASSSWRRIIRWVRAASALLPLPSVPLTNCPEWTASRVSLSLFQSVASSIEDPKSTYNAQTTISLNNIVQLYQNDQWVACISRILVLSRALSWEALLLYTTGCPFITGQELCKQYRGGLIHAILNSEYNDNLFYTELHGNLFKNSIRIYLVWDFILRPWTKFLLDEIFKGSPKKGSARNVTFDQRRSTHGACCKKTSDLKNVRPQKRLTGRTFRHQRHLWLVVANVQPSWNVQPPRSDVFLQQAPGL